MSTPQPPRIAVALEYDGQNAPRVTAKGSGELAERIVETAREHDVAVEQNPILAQALSAVELDDEIPEELYRATAQVIAFVLSLRGELSRQNRDGQQP
ncbi:EscU/YscU/HrcU family type III secretion system export apparatus switch protein [Bosea sp. BH3]|uniref:EscU/YscU/HrcU family type III secretion system export apparatus switch protein n=1 Tax=Bosea sp. BH3 TaxID=2871701 RepID=UPI0021CAEDF5|nr:EscU/YscU/HrcU family type III secretion system export apparatus switch protein [Bosea sp. BH3]MCU4180793.1 EscU/YscU/HrcU family type III secretion system export apparatus switch protein [Bosea sp. BH3]